MFCLFSDSFSSMLN